MLIGFGTTETPQATGSGLVGWWKAQDRNVQILLGVSAAALLATGAWALLGRGSSKKVTPNRRRKAGSRKARRNGRVAGHKSLSVSRVRLDRGGYDHYGRYFGIAKPLYFVEDAESGQSTYLRASSFAQAKKMVTNAIARERSVRTAFSVLHSSGGDRYLPNRDVKRARLSCQAAPSVPSCRCAPPKKYRKSGATKASDYAFPECFMYPVHTAKYTRAAASRFGKFGGNIPTMFRGKVRKRIDRAKKRFGIGPFRA